VQPFRSAIARLRALPPGRADALLAAVLLAEGAAEVLLLTELDAAKTAAALGLLVVEAVALALRRRLPLLAVVVVFGLEPVLQTFGRGLIDHVAGPMFWLLFVAYTLGAHTQGRRLWAGAAIASALIIVGTAVEPYDDDVLDYVSSVALFVLGPVLFGQALRNRARLNQALHAKAERAEQERAAAAAAAALAERTRIAGELHDVVAHALSAMVVQASGARRLAERDPQRAGEAFLAVETSGREALTEIRNLLGVLRREDEELALAPQPSLRHVATLVSKAQAAGLPVELVVEGEARELPIGVDLTAYRVVQEALGGAVEPGNARHARVLIRYGGDHVELEVIDDGGEPSRPLLGIHERVTLAHGQLQAGARRDGGHVVRARLPLGASA
jgi:signal transduction histidine kinase